MSSQRHPKKEVREALELAAAHGWKVEKKHGHAWGVIRCGKGCKASVSSTPKNPGNHAKQIKRAVLSCPHTK